MPIIIGLLLWKQLPDSVATHFGADNQPNGYTSKVFAVFGLPFILLMIHLVCVIVTNIDPKAKNISPKVFRVVLWICPLVSLGVCSTIYAYNFGYQFHMVFVDGLLIGVFYLILGNFIPKIKPNFAIGFRVPWALCDSENWCYTHRFGGKCMVIGGIVLIATSPLQNVWMLAVFIIIPCILPAIYSYLYYRKTID